MKENNVGKIGVLFDLDGVLVDSEGEYSKFWGATGRKFNVGGDSFADDIKGTTLGEILQSFAENDREGIVKSLYEFESDMSFPVFPGVIDFLRALKTNNIPSAIVTSSDDTKMGYLFRKHPEFHDYVDIIITGSMVSHSKPDPEGYLLGASKIGVAPEDCYVFEDSMQGVEAGMRSGATVVAIATTNSHAKLLTKSPHYIIDSFVQLSIVDGKIRIAQ
ncbi:MAG: HAD family phosphatase [Duncaniella sp.]|nr:HAD family phosphatase [Duncaniella sp.]